MLEVVGMNLNCHHGGVDGYQIVIWPGLLFEVPSRVELDLSVFQADTVGFRPKNDYARHRGTCD